VVCSPAAPLLWGQNNLDLTGDLARDFALQGQNVPKITLVTLSPQVPVAYGVDELGGNADSIA
jgi:hypothetical protein